MGTLNQVTILGRLGQDPDMRITQSGKQVCNMSVATSEGSGDNQVTEWHKVTLWEKAAEIAGKYLQKGSQVLIMGRIQTRKYQAADGSDRYSTEIVGNRVVLVDPPPADGSTTAPKKAPPKQMPANDEDVPF